MDFTRVSIQPGAPSAAGTSSVVTGPFLMMSCLVHVPIYHMKGNTAGSTSEGPKVGKCTGLKQTHSHHETDT